MNQRSLNTLVVILGCTFGAAIVFSLYILFSVVTLRNTLASSLDEKHPSQWLTVGAISHDFRSALLTAIDGSYEPCAPSDYWKTALGMGGADSRAVCVLPRILSSELTTPGLQSLLMGGLIVARLPQESIFDEVLNRMSYGQSCGTPVFGAANAARIYFRKAARDLSSSEIAELLAIYRNGTPLISQEKCGG